MHWYLCSTMSTNVLPVHIQLVCDYYNLLQTLYLQLGLKHQIVCVINNHYSHTGSKGGLCSALPGLHHCCTVCLLKLRKDRGPNPEQKPKDGRASVLTNQGFGKTPFSL